MWIFAWVLGTGFACCLAVINGIWFEFKGQSPKENRS